MRRACASALLALALLAPSTPAGSASGDAPEQRDLSTLLSHFAASRGVFAHFREEKSLPLLQEPLVSEGLLYYAPPGRMARFTTRPEHTSLLVVEDRLRIEDGLGVEEIDLGAHPEARRFIAEGTDIAEDADEPVDPARLLLLDSLVALIWQSLFTNQLPDMLPLIAEAAEIGRRIDELAKKACERGDDSDGQSITDTWTGP